MIFVAPTVLKSEDQSHLSAHVSPIYFGLITPHYQGPHHNICPHNQNHFPHKDSTDLAGKITAAGCAISGVFYTPSLRLSLNLPSLRLFLNLPSLRLDYLPSLRLLLTCQVKLDLLGSLQIEMSHVVFV